MGTFDKDKFMKELDKVTNLNEIRDELKDLKSVDFNPFDNDDARKAAAEEAKQIGEAYIALVVGVDLAAKASGVTSGEDKLQLATEFIINECLSLPWYMKPFKGFINKLVCKYMKGALSAVVSFLNAKVGNAWSKDTPEDKRLAEKPVEEPA